MAITQIRQSYNPGQEFGKALGGAAQSSIAGLMEGLVQSKLQQLGGLQQQKAQQDRLRSLEAIGYSPQEAQLASLIPEKDLYKFLSTYQPGGQQQQQGGSLENLLGALQQPQQQASLQDMLGQQGLPQSAIGQALGQTQLQQPQEQQQVMQQLQQLLGGQQQAAQPQEALSPVQRLQKSIQQQQSEETPKEMRERLLEERKESSKETLPYYTELTKASKAAKDSNMRLDRMETLIDKGTLQSNVFVRALEGLSRLPYVGSIASAVEAAFFLNKDSQEFKKLSTDFLKDAKNVFGSRITQKEIELFLDTVPTLMLSDPGKKAVIHNIRLFNKGALLRKEEANKIIKENSGYRPRNLDELVEKRIEKDLNKITEKFKAGLSFEDKVEKQFKVFKEPLFKKKR